MPAKAEVDDLVKNRILDLRASGLSIDKISKDVKLSTHIVKNVLKDNPYLEENDRYGDNAAKELVLSPEWAKIQQQFSKIQCDEFMYHYRKMFNQFKGDITHTERIQIQDLIKNEILANELLQKKKVYEDEIFALTKEVKQERALNEGAVTEKIIQMESVLANAHKSSSDYIKQYHEALKQKQAILKDMKATRDQRVERFHKDNKSIGDWMADLISDPDMRKSMGIHLEKTRLASEVELERLSDYHKFMDGEVEQPILTSDLVKKDNKNG